MIVKFHPYQPNGLGAHDENGHVRCTCGFLREQHADPPTMDHAELDALEREHFGARQSNNLDLDMLGTIARATADPDA